MGLVSVVRFAFCQDSYSFTDASVDDWMSILKLSTQYEIDHVRGLAMARLHGSQIDPLRKILIWREYNLDPSLLIPSYVSLCQRSEPLTFDIAAAISSENFVRLAAAREVYRQRMGCEHSINRTTAEQAAIAEEVVRQLFAKPGPRPAKRKKMGGVSTMNKA
ncbi:hypothetical protein DXG01_010107 [Tephrocybe rancida]|nr:hypothetical protein DXG01_010107 [Tephrocybe rancida]